jgi:hypothetical protein
MEPDSDSGHLAGCGVLAGSTDNETPLNPANTQLVLQPFALLRMGASIPTLG